MKHEVTSITHNIKVSVKTTFLPQQSSAKQRCFVFAYQIEIENLSDEPVQLIARKWIITNGFGEKDVVKGMGVVGETPVIMPKQSYKYISGTHFPYTVGCMEGIYYMNQLTSNKDIEVRIPKFVMEVPYIYN